MKKVARSFALADPNVEEGDGLVWKTIIRTGRWEVSPNGGASKPLVFVSGHSTDLQHAIGLKDIYDSFEAGAIEHVTIPKTHADKVDENTGVVKKLKIVDIEGGHQELKAGLSFTDAQILQKVNEGSILNSSSGLVFNYQRKEDGRIFPVALDHVALTNKPWLNRLSGFGMAQEGAEDESVLCMNFSDESLSTDESTTPISEDAVDVSLKIGDLTLTSDQVDALKRHFGVDGTTTEPTTTLSDQSNSPKGNEMKTKEELEAERKAAEEAAAAAASQTQIGLSEDQVKDLLKPVAAQNAVLLAQNQKLMAEARKTDTDKFLGTLREIGLSEDNGCTAFLKEVSQICLGDDGQKILTLSQEGENPDVDLSAAELLKRVLLSLPTDEKTGKLKMALSQQTIDPLGLSKVTKPQMVSGDGPVSANLSEEEMEKHVDDLAQRLGLAAS